MANGIDCRSGERIDWTPRGVPADLECYAHRDYYPDGPYVAIWDPVAHRHALEPERCSSGVLSEALSLLGRR